MLISWISAPLASRSSLVRAFASNRIPEAGATSSAEAPPQVFDETTGRRHRSSVRHRVGRLFDGDAANLLDVPPLHDDPAGRPLSFEPAGDGPAERRRRLPGAEYEHPLFGRVRRGEERRAPERPSGARRATEAAGEDRGGVGGRQPGAEHPVEIPPQPGFARRRRGVGHVGHSGPFAAAG